MRFSEYVNKRKRNGKIIYDGILCYYDENGKRRFAHRERKSRIAARDAIRDLRAKLERGGPTAVLKAKTTFAELADYCEKHVYKAAAYDHEGDKIDGYTGTDVYKAHIDRFRVFFKNTRLQDITVDDILRYRSKRLREKRITLVYEAGKKEPKRVEKNITASTVERELTTLRSMLNRAIRNNWAISRNPFEQATRNEIFKPSSRKPRSLFLTFAQEKAILDNCQSEERRHLRALILTAIDTGARYGELINLRLSQLDWDAENGRGKILGLKNYKGSGGDKSVRNAMMSQRVREALLDIINNPPKIPSRSSKAEEIPADSVFHVRRITTTWKNTLRDAGLLHLGLHFHDLRHTPGTRLKELVALPVIQKALGHKDPKLTAEVYINDVESDLITFCDAIELATKIGYQKLEEEQRAEKQKADGNVHQQSTLVS